MSSILRFKMLCSKSNFYFSSRIASFSVLWNSIRSSCYELKYRYQPLILWINLPLDDVILVLQFLPLPLTIIFKRPLLHSIEAIFYCPDCCMRIHQFPLFGLQFMALEILSRVGISITSTKNNLSLYNLRLWHFD